MIQTSLFPLEPVSHKASDLSCPNGYSGFSAFHKYWGKKPVECLSFLIENLHKQLSASKIVVLSKRNS